MTKLSLIGICFLSLLLACDQEKKSEISFESPQPESSASLSAFPKKLAGTYLNSAKNKQLVLSKDLLVLTCTFISKIHPDQLDSVTVLEGDLLIDISTGVSEKVNLEGDSIVNRFTVQDTLFSLANGGILKKYRGFWILNSGNIKNHWHVSSLALSKGNLILQEVADPADLEILRNITQMQADSSSHFRPTKKQFARFLKARNSENSEQFFRQK